VKPVVSGNPQRPLTDLKGAVHFTVRVVEAEAGYLKLRLATGRELVARVGDDITFDHVIDIESDLNVRPRDV
jgi:hypothetical protein